MQKASSNEFRGQLKALVESIVSEHGRLKDRGLFFCIDEMTVKGHPPAVIRLWGTLHFLPLGSPFCCMEPGCHLPVFAGSSGCISEAVGHALHLQQGVDVELVTCASRIHEGVEADNLATGRSPSFDWYDADRRDLFGRTALLRAALRGYDRFVEELVAAGADPDLKDAEGRSAREVIAKKWPWLKC